MRTNLPLIHYFPVDISELKQKDMETLLRLSEKKYGPIEMVICCAAISKPSLFTSSDLD
jgi:short-subunit dehydrogenase